MSKILPTGSSFYIATGYGSSKTMSAISNAAAAVATLEASHGFIVSDVGEVTSGWGRLDGRVARISAVATNDVTLEGIKTTSTSLYPAGSGVGSIKEISGWQEITQVKDPSSNVGQLEFADVSDLKDVVRKRVPTVRGAADLTLTVFDDPALAWYTYVTDAHEAATPVAYKILLPNASVIYGRAYWSLDKIPKFSGREALTAIVTLSFDGEPTRYAS